MLRGSMCVLAICAGAGAEDSLGSLSATARPNPIAAAARMKDRECMVPTFPAKSMGPANLGP
ncbi:hypothetical protein ASY01nite_13680 [Acetobacter syzygii]|nr:hypothetical protein Absy_100_147 [Acetobacter syzygii]GBR66648.1 hypothetical protein AA0483_2427 [Acetobacter syzygii NRIC 0483]GEL56302.1 hypothetical protein ASY01nite_13680 [Acetobacter syzygii]